MDWEITIRPATEADARATVPLWAEFLDFHSCRDEWFTRAECGGEHWEKFVCDRVNDPRSIVLVAELGGEVLGYSIGTLNMRPLTYAELDYATITDLAVSSKARRTGIGVRLATEMIKRLQDRGVNRIEIGVATTNEVSTSFWRKMGFVPFMEKCVYDPSRCEF
jgi:ribosomal protein S18 acetylase RimI-like enzyme